MTFIIISSSSIVIGATEKLAYACYKNNVIWRYLIKRFQFGLFFSSHSFVSHFFLVESWENKKKNVIDFRLCRSVNNDWHFYSSLLRIFLLSLLFFLPSLQAIIASFFFSPHFSFYCYKFMFIVDGIDEQHNISLVSSFLFARMLMMSCPIKSEQKKNWYFFYWIEFHCMSDGFVEKFDWIASIQI